jgi:hypothetical protein
VFSSIRISSYLLRQSINQSSLPSTRSDCSALARLLSKYLALLDLDASIAFNSVKSYNKSWILLAWLLPDSNYVVTSLGLIGGKTLWVGRGKYIHTERSRGRPCRDKARSRRAWHSRCLKVGTQILRTKLASLNYQAASAQPLAADPVCSDSVSARPPFFLHR